jgi:hypothetical protein
MQCGFSRWVRAVSCAGSHVCATYSDESAKPGGLHALPLGFGLCMQCSIVASWHAAASYTV